MCIILRHSLVAILIIHASFIFQPLTMFNTKNCLEEFQLKSTSTRLFKSDNTSNTHENNSQRQHLYPTNEKFIKVTPDSFKKGLLRNDTECHILIQMKLCLQRGWYATTMTGIVIVKRFSFVPIGIFTFSKNFLIL